MFPKEEVFDLFKQNTSMSFLDLHTKVKEAYNYDLMYGQYAMLVGLAFLAKQDKKTLEEAWDNHMVMRPEQIFNLPIKTQTAVGPDGGTYIIKSQGCGSCGGGKVL